MKTSPEIWKLKSCDVCKDPDVDGGYFFPFEAGSIACCTKTKCMEVFGEITTDYIKAMKMEPIKDQASKLREMTSAPSGCKHTRKGMDARKCLHCEHDEKLDKIVKLHITSMETLYEKINALTSKVEDLEVQLEELQSMEGQ